MSLLWEWHASLMLQGDWLYLLPGAANGVGSLILRACLSLFLIGTS